MQSSLSEIEDIDLAEAVSRFEQDMLALQAAQQSFNMVQSLTLFNYL
jgi:flagellar hook-associated protein 3 FlgL